MSAVKDCHIRKPICEKAAYGHFGRTPWENWPWRRGKTFFSSERTDRVRDLQEAVNG